MVHYECAIDSYNNSFYYDLDCLKLKKELNVILRAQTNKVKKLKR